MTNVARSNFHILIAEDDPDDQYLINQALAQTKYQASITFASNGRELLTQLERKVSLEETPNLVILDLNMPEVGGFEAIENIKKNPLLSSIPITIFSTSHLHEDRTRSLQLGAIGYWEKPDNLFEYQKSLEEMINEAQPSKKQSHSDTGQSKTQEEKEKIKVMIMEDDPEDIYLLRGLLNHDRHRRYEITSARTIDDLLHLDSTYRFDVILLDLNLPDSFGVETLQQTANYLPDVPIIVISGEFNSEREEILIKAGASDYLAKSELTTYLVNKSIAFAIERNKLIIELQHQATSDTLTGLANRTRFNDRLDLMIDLCDRSKQTLAVAFIDIDNFKPINDKYGHSIGDSLLVQFASRMKRHIRRSDVAARFGGDEFAVLVYDFHNSEGLKSVVDKLIGELSKPYNLLDGDNKIQIKITTSVGVVQWQDGQTTQSIMRIADRQMYEVKNSGKASIKYH